MTTSARQRPAAANALTRRWSIVATDGSAAATLLVVGILLVAVAPAIKANAFVMRPGIDGSLAVGILGCLLSLLHGLPYRRVLSMLAPAIAVQAVCCLRFQVSLFAYFGIEFIAWGALGLAALALRQRLGAGSPQSARLDRSLAASQAPADLAAPSNRR